MKKQQGFTLIELVVVIIILGILAVTAAPKFINLQDDAKASSIAGLAGAIRGANSLVYSKAALIGIEGNGTGLVDVLGNSGPGADGINGTADDTDAGDDVPVVFGYIAATEAALEAGLEVTVDASSVVNPTADWIITIPSTPNGTATLHQNGTAAGNVVTCSILYTQGTAAAAATAVIRNNDC